MVIKIIMLVLTISIKISTKVPASPRSLLRDQSLHHPHQGGRGDGLEPAPGDRHPDSRDKLQCYPTVPLHCVLIQGS